ncbi:MAG: hypothetical protein B6242_03220 [Anaerolineaceae bacterium 4572_78]|nr:MAG: hypothetical protein B6242_03220 [Anaerolineaceae bacterium 4572_78]
MVQITKLLKYLFLICLISLGLGLIFTPTSYAIDPETFGEPANLANTAVQGLQSGRPTIAIYDGTIAVLWSDGFNTDEATKEAGHVYLQSATETGSYWRPKIKVMDATRDDWSLDPKFIFDNNGDKVHVVWAQANSCADDLTTCQFEAIYYTQCDLSGDTNTCLTPQIVAEIETYIYRTPDIVQDNMNNLHVVWNELIGNKVYYSRGEISSENVDWSTPTEVSEAVDGNAPQIAFSNGRLHLVWGDFSAMKINHLYLMVITSISRLTWKALPLRAMIVTLFSMPILLIMVMFSHLMA